MSAVQQRFILQRSLNPIAPRSFGLVALQKVKQGRCFKILTKQQTPSSSSSSLSPTQQFESVAVDLMANNNNENSSSTQSPFHDLSESPKTLFDFLFRRYMWNIRESAEIDNNGDQQQQQQQQVILLPPQFLFLKTDFTCYALTDPKFVAEQIFDARPESERTSAYDQVKQEQAEHDLFESLVFKSNNTRSDSSSISASSSSSDNKTVLRNSMLLSHVLSINDSCSMPVPAPMASTKNSSSSSGFELDVNFFRAFPQLIQEYELVSAENENCRLELITEEEYQELFFDDENESGSNNNNEKNSTVTKAVTKAATKEVVGRDDRGREIHRLDGKELDEEDRILGKLKNEFDVTDPDQDIIFINDNDNNYRKKGAGDVAYEARLRKRSEMFQQRRSGRDGGNSAFARREAQRNANRKAKLDAHEQQVEEEEEEEEVQNEQQEESSSFNNNKKQSDKLHLILRVTKDIPAGSEFFLSYGREYWTHFVGACAFTSSTSLPRIRWAEKYLLGADRNFRDLAAAFPDLTIGRPKRGQYFLVDRLTESAASDEAVVAEFVRRISIPKEEQEPKEQQQGQDGKTNHDLFRELLNQTAHRLLEKNLKKVMMEEAEKEQQGNNDDEDDDAKNALLVQKAAQAAARDGTEGLLKQELDLKKDVRMLLAKDILMSKKHSRKVEEKTN